MKPFLNQLCTVGSASRERERTSAAAAGGGPYPLKWEVHRCCNIIWESIERSFVRSVVDEGLLDYNVRVS